jgi:hypothetical protein
VSVDRCCDVAGRNTEFDGDRPDDLPGLSKVVLLSRVAVVPFEVVMQRMGWFPCRINHDLGIKVALLVPYAARLCNGLRRSSER